MKKWKYQIVHILNVNDSEIIFTSTQTFDSKDTASMAGLKFKIENNLSDLHLIEVI